MADTSAPELSWAKGKGGDGQSNDRFRQRIRNLPIEAIAGFLVFSDLKLSARDDRIFSRSKKAFADKRISGMPDEQAIECTIPKRRWP